MIRITGIMPGFFSSSTLILIALACLSLALPASLDLTSPMLNWDFAFSIRLPRLLTAAGAGACVAVAGTLSQAIFRNPIASPSVIGSESGASLAVALAVSLFGAYISTQALSIFAFVGAAVVTTTCMIAIRYTRNIVKVMIIGFTINALLGSLTSFVVLRLLEQGTGQRVLGWLLGSFSGRAFEDGALSIASLFLVLIVILPMASRFDLLTFGDEISDSTGIDSKKTRFLGLLSVSILTGVAISTGGALPFVSLIVPHFCRRYVGSLHKRLILASAISGCILVIASDFVARSATFPVELPVGLVTTILGAPYFVYAISREHAS
jgi:iron complex transport system permease protein